jgi:hypothetical protein
MNFLKQISSDHGADGGWFALRQYKKAMDAKETPLSNRHIHQSLSTTEKNKYNFLDSPDKQHSYETSTEFAPRDEELSPKEKQIPESNKYKRKPLKIKTNITDNYEIHPTENSNSVHEGIFNQEFSRFDAVDLVSVSEEEQIEKKEKEVKSTEIQPVPHTHDFERKRKGGSLSQARDKTVELDSNSKNEDEVKKEERKESQKKNNTNSRSNSKRKNKNNYNSFDNNNYININIIRTEPYISKHDSKHTFRYIIENIPSLDLPHASTSSTNLLGQQYNKNNNTASIGNMHKSTPISPTQHAYSSHNSPTAHDYHSHQKIHNSHPHYNIHLNSNNSSPPQTTHSNTNTQNQVQDNLILIPPNQNLQINSLSGNQFQSQHSNFNSQEQNTSSPESASHAQIKGAIQNVSFQNNNKFNQFKKINHFNLTNSEVQSDHSHVDTESDKATAIHLKSPDPSNPYKKKQFSQLTSNTNSETNKSPLTSQISNSESILNKLNMNTLEFDSAQKLESYSKHELVVCLQYLHQQLQGFIFRFCKTF